MTAERTKTIGSDGTLTIAKKQLAVNPVAASKIYGASDPDLTWTYTGFVNDEDATSAAHATTGKEVRAIQNSAWTPKIGRKGMMEMVLYLWNR